MNDSEFKRRQKIMNEEFSGNTGMAATTAAKRKRPKAA